MTRPPVPPTPSENAALSGEHDTGWLAAARKWLGRVVEPKVLFPTIAVVMLAAMWGSTFNLIRIEGLAAERAATDSSRELAGTYEAQVIRALREIDQTLKFVQYASLEGRPGGLLERLDERELLLPKWLFDIGIADRQGNIIETTGPADQPNIGGQDYFRGQRQSDAFMVSLPQPDGNGGWKLHFSRRLSGPDGSFAGIVEAAVDAAYFVSSYESTQLGDHGVIGLLGADGIFRVKRSGEAVDVGQQTDYAALVLAAERADDVFRAVHPWDGERRYTSVRPLNVAPIAVIVGLSERERLAAVRHNAPVYLWRTLGLSLVLVLVLWRLGRMSHALAVNRQQAVEEHMAHAKRVEYLAYHDGLTGLPNRSLFSKLLVQSLHQAQRYHRHLGVLFLDLDRFKQINDTLGHDAGDDLLTQVASRLQGAVRDSDTVARLGGDEFVVLLPELENEKDGAIVAQRILASISRPFLLVGQEFRVTTSIGISIYPQDGLDEQTLKKNADVAMYKAKQEGRNNFQFYSAELNAHSLERLTLESSLRQALEKDEFELHYQARHGIRTDTITGMEVLLRWRHPQLGLIAPTQFLAVAEETGLIVPIGRWVLSKACRQNMAWQQEGLHVFNISVNLAAAQFYDERLLADLRKILQETGMPAHLLQLEISEHLLLRDVEKTLQLLNALRDMDIKIAIDDFGTGYSSLSMLKQFPLDMIKIDRAYIRNIADDDSEHGSQAMAEAIIAMGRLLSLTVVAQGVETEAQAEFLRRHACDEFQGFYFNSPLPADQVAEHLRTLPGTESLVSGRETGASGLRPSTEPRFRGHMPGRRGGPCS